MERERISYLLKKYVNQSLELGKKIGHGGMGHVYDVLGYNCEAVLKVVDVEALADAAVEGLSEAAKAFNYPFYYETYVEKTRMEIDYLKQLKGTGGITNLIDAYEIEAPKKCFFIIQEKYQELDSFIQTQNLTEGLVIQIAKNVLAMLEIMESKKILHRDIKPGNLFIKWENGKPRFILGDFGIARNVSFKAGQVTIAGTPAFGAPELMESGNIIGFNSDIFSLGASLFCILTQGKIPAMYFMRDMEPVLEQGSKELQRIVMKAIEYDPKKRYQHASEMLRDLNALSNVNNTEPIIYNANLYLAKKALQEGKMLQAQIEAMKGFVEKKDSKEGMACFRILMYIKMKRESDYRNLIPTEVEMLAEIANDGDAVAQYLYGMYLVDTKRESQGLVYIKKSADNGSEIGCYVYGRMLCQGYTGVTKDIRKGITYLENAARRGYIPSIRYLKRIQQNYQGNYRPDVEIARLLGVEIKNYEELKMTYIVPFL